MCYTISMQEKMLQNQNPLVGQILEESREVLEKINDLRRKMATTAKDQLEVVDLEILVEQELGDELEIVGASSEKTENTLESANQIQCHNFISNLNSLLLQQQTKALEAFNAHEIDFEVLTRRNNAIIHVWQDSIKKAIRRFGQDAVRKVIDSVPQLEINIYRRNNYLT